MQAFVPHSLDEALELRADHPEALLVAGGTDVMVAVNLHGLRPPAVLDLSHVVDLQTWRAEQDGTLFLGAGLTFARIARELAVFRPLAQAALSVGSPQIRNRATIGGNVATASPAGDGIVALAAYGAEVVLGRVGLTRRLACHEFFLGPKRTALEPDELILGLRFRQPGGPGAFAKVGPRSAMVIAVAGVCVQLDEHTHDVRLALGSVGPTVFRATAAEQLAASELDWNRPDERVLREFGLRAAAEAKPIDDVRGTAAYRRHAVDVLSRRLLREVLVERSAA